MMTLWLPGGPVQSAAGLGRGMAQLAGDASPAMDGRTAGARAEEVPETPADDAEAPPAPDEPAASDTPPLTAPNLSQSEAAPDPPSGSVRVEPSELPTVTPTAMLTPRLLEPGPSAGAPFVESLPATGVLPNGPPPGGSA
jgi:hypothetical protein